MTRKQLELGVVGVVMGFDPLAQFDDEDTRGPRGEYKYFWFAQQLEAQTNRFTRFSLPVVADPAARDEFVTLVERIAALGYKVVGVAMFTDQDPGDPAQQQEAEAHLRNIFDACTAAGITEIMGPTGFQWGRGADEKPLEREALSAFLVQSATVQANVLNNLPPSCTVKLVSSEFLCGAEGNKIVDAPTAIRLADLIHSQYNGSIEVGIALDTAHAYFQLDTLGHARHGKKSLEILQAENHNAFSGGHVTLSHISAEASRAHPLENSMMPLEDHLKRAIADGYDGPHDIECFDYTDKGLQGMLRGIGPGSFDITKPWEPYIQTAAQIDDWTAA